MEIIGVLLRQVTIMFCLMAIGYLGYRKKWISDQGTMDIGKLLLNVALPMIVISNFWVEKTDEKVHDLLFSLILTLICMFISMIVSRVFFHKTDRIGEFSATFSNAGFIGIPIVQALYGNKAVFYISMMIAMINVFQWTYGVFTITDDKSAMDIGKVLRNPTVLAVIAGLILFFLEIPMPSILDSVFDTIGGINTPLAMFSSGVYLARTDLLSILKKGRVYLVCAVRLLVIPLVTILLMKVFPWGSTEMKMSILCAAACPVGVSVSIFAQQYGKDYTKGVEYVSASTLLCIITIPVIVFIATKLI